MVTLLPSTITGTFRTPSEYLSISSNFVLSNLTSKYSALSPKANLAFSVNGQPALPKMMTFSPIYLPPYYMEKSLNDFYIKIIKKHYSKLENKY
jgi:hypothetical protein